MENLFFVKPLAFDTTTGPVFDDAGRELFGVFSFEDGPDETPYCFFSGRFQGRFICDFSGLPQRASLFGLLSVCPEMIFRLRKPFGNKDANSDCLTGRKTSLFSNFFGNLDNNSLWL